MYIGHDKIECYDKNWMKVYHDIETLFESWEKKEMNIIWEMLCHKFTSLCKAYLYCKYF